MTKIHDNYHNELININANNAISLLYHGYTTTNTTNYSFITYILDNAGNLIINTTDNYLNNITINKLSQNSLFFVTTKSNEYNIIIQYENNINYLYDQKGMLIYK